MLYFLTSLNNPDSQQKNGQESSQVFSKVNLIATTPKGLALLVLGVLAFSLLTFVIGFVLGKETAATELKQERAAATSRSSRPIPGSVPPDTPIDSVCSDDLPTPPSN